MRIHSESSIHHPLDLVYSAYRDKLPEIAPYTPDVKEIVVHKREDTDVGVNLHNEWRAERDLPKIMEKLITPDMLRWDDFAEWNDNEKHVDWVLRIPAFPDQVKCVGRNAFLSEGENRTRVILTGDLEISLKRVPGVPRIMAGRIAPMIEAFIVKLITPNLEKVNASLERYLDDQQR